MKYISLSVLLVALPLLIQGQQKAPAPAKPGRFEKTIYSHWTFNYFPSETADKGFETSSFNDSRWPAISLPHTWNTYETTGDRHPFIMNASETDSPYWWAGWGWYRKHFTVSNSYTGKKVFIEFDGVQKYCKVWLNGRYLGDHKGGYGSFDFDVTTYVNFGGDNVLAVAVNSRQKDRFGIPPMAAGNFNVYGGIYRDVRIVLKDKLYIPMQGSASHEGGTFITTPAVSEKEGNVRVQTWVKNDYPQKKTCILRTKIIDAAGRTVQQFQATADIEPLKMHRFDQLSAAIKAPHLWSPEKPYVYKVISEVMIGTAVVDSYTSAFGFRWFRRDSKENLLYLNGKKVILQGAYRHQDYPWLGDAIPWHISEADITDMRNALNYNFMRTAHYPQDSRVYTMADNLGIIIEEGVPNINNQEFSGEVQKQQLTEMIRRDRNHPSILFWSMGNETDHAVDSKYALAEDSTRIITAGKTGRNSAGEYVARGEDSLYTRLYADHGAGREYPNTRLVNVNPEGCVDMYRIPKSAYWFWQANYGAKPIVFIQPHFWRSANLGQKMDIVVYSNCEKVELKVNGISKGIKEPGASNFHTVVFTGVTVEKGTLQAIGTRGSQPVSSQVTMAGDPRRIVLKTVQSIDADRGSVAIVTAAIQDAEGNPVYGAKNTLRWSVSGPARLAGLPVYESDIEKNNAKEGSGYIDTPVSNLIRSSGTPGLIKITVSSTGLTSGTAEIKALEVQTDNSVISEAPLSDSGRQPVARPAQPSQKVSAVPRELKNASGDLSLPKGNVTPKGVRDFILGENPGTDTATVEFRMLTSLLVLQLVNNEGRIIADDYNFFINSYNNCRLITAYIAPLKLPQVFKDGLRQYYADGMIRKGIEKNPALELNWMNWIPSGGTVVVSSGGKAGAWPKGTIITNRNALEDIIAEVHPQFPGFSAEARERALAFIVKMNPYVQKAEVIEVNSKGEKVTNVTFSAEKDQPILIPMLKFIAE